MRKSRRSSPSAGADPSRLLSLPSSDFPHLGRGKRVARYIPIITGSRHGEAIESKTLCDMQVPKEYSLRGYPWFALRSLAVSK